MISSMMAVDKGPEISVKKIAGQLQKCVFVYTHHFSCVDQHETAMADLNTKLKNTEEKLQSANKCENSTNAALELFFTM